MANVFLTWEEVRERIGRDYEEQLANLWSEWEVSQDGELAPDLSAE